MVMEITLLTVLMSISWLAGCQDGSEGKVLAARPDDWG